MQQTRNLTVLDAIVDLQKRGYSLDFIVMGDQLFCAQQKIFLRQEEFDISEMYSCQPENARQETVVYGIESQRHAIRGILLSQPAQESAAVPPILFKKMGKFWD